jgi:hypothetical protein
MLKEEAGLHWEIVLGKIPMLVNDNDSTDFETAGLPHKVKEIAGIESLGYFVEGDVHKGNAAMIDGHHSLSSMNDSGYYSFEDIADFIEEHF